MKIKQLISIAFIGAFIFSTLTLTSSKAADSKGNAYGFWTKARLESAQPIELVVDEKTKTGKIVREMKGTNSTSSTSTSGANWGKGGNPLNWTGKIFFTAGQSTYVCSGAFVNDNLIGKSIVQTAGHCAWDQGSSSFVSNFVFIPAYQSNPVNDCSTNPDRCFIGEKIYVRNDFANQTSFNSISLLNDWAYVVLNKEFVGGFNINFDNNYKNGNVSSFGYPAVAPYNGKQLINCQNPIFKDLKNANNTWGMNCSMTGGASGGPWIYPWDSLSNTGIIFSLNSYKYGTDKSKMYGPMFNSTTADTFNSANSNIGYVASGVKAS